MRHRIGEFARLGGVSIKTLRFYDQQKLLVPVEIDARTRYRYYATSQLKDLTAIRALQQLGAALGDIRCVLRSASSGERRRLLETLRTNARRSIDSAQRSLQWIDLELEGLSQDEPAMTIVINPRAELRIASIRARLARYDDICAVERELARAVEPAYTRGTRGVLWHRCEASGAIEGEPFIEVSHRLRRSSGYLLQELPRVMVASTFCEVDDIAAVRAYEAIDRWVHQHQLRINGPKREIYVGNLLEIQFPVI